MSHVYGVGQIPTSIDQTRMIQYNKEDDFKLETKFIFLFSPWLFVKDCLESLTRALDSRVKHPSWFRLETNIPSYNNSK